MPRSRGGAGGRAPSRPTAAPASRSNNAPPQQRPHSTMAQPQAGQKPQQQQAPPAQGQQGSGLFGQMASTAAYATPATSLTTSSSHPQRITNLFLVVSLSALPSVMQSAASSAVAALLPLSSSKLRPSSMTTTSKPASNSHTTPPTAMRTARPRPRTSRSVSIRTMATCRSAAGTLNS